MNHSRLSATLPVPLPETRAPFHLVVAYEDQSTRSQALHLTHRLSRQLGEDYNLEGSWWRFDHLTDDVLRAQATRAAAEANMIIVSLLERPALTPAQHDWLTEALAARRPDSPKAALVALNTRSRATPSSPPTAAPGVIEQLRNLAAGAGLDFFAHTFEEPGARPDAVQARVARSETGGPIPVPRPARSKVPVLRWGINE